MKYYTLRILLVAIFAIIPLCASDAAEESGNKPIGGEQAPQKVEYTIQVMAAKDNQAAHAFAETLTAKGYDVYVVTVADDGTDLPNKVRFGRFDTKQDAQLAAESYERRESASCFVTQDRSIRFEASAPVAQPVSPQVAAAASSESFFERYVPEAPVEALLGRTFLEITPKFAYRLEYSDNIGYDSKDRVSDWSNHYVPEIEINANSPNLSLKTTAKLDIAEYFDEKDFNRVDQVYNFDLGYLPNERLELNLTSGYSVISSTNRSWQDVSVGNPTLNFSNDKEKEQVYGGGFSYEVSPRSTIGLSGFFTRYNNSDTNGSNFYGAVADYAYKLSPRTNLKLNAGTFYYDYKYTYNTDYTYDYAAGSDFKMTNYSLTGGFDHTFETDFKISAQAGYRISNNDYKNNTTNPGQGTSGTGDGWVAEVAAQRRFNDFLFSFQGHHDISVDPRGSAFEATSFLFSTQYDITRRLEAHLMLRWFLSKADGNKDAYTTERDQRTYYINTGLGYQLYRWLLVSLMHSYQYTDDRTNNDTRFANIFYVNFQFTPTRPLVLR